MALIPTSLRPGRPRAPVVALALLAGLVLPAALAAGTPPRALLQALFPQMDEVTTALEKPPVVAVRGNGRLLGYAWLTDDIAPIPAYSGKPIRALVGLDPAGHIRGVRIVAHAEPILAVGITEARLQRFLDQYEGLDVRRRIRVGGARGEDRQVVDTISGATITVMVLNASITRSAAKVAEILSLGEQPAPGAAAPALWRQAWEAKRGQVIVLSGILWLLLIVLVLQDWLARHATLLSRFRLGFLVFTLVYTGWYALGQLSVVNVLTFVHSLLRGFSWESYLMDPVLFVLWGFTAMTVLLWGRGVYCGWLCPFGALQDLLYRLARRLRLPAWELPQVVHERLCAIKYLVFLGLFAVSLQFLPDAIRLAEIEPFKTAIVMHFDREWPFVLFAGSLLFVGLFVRKFYCRYLCPLGAALTFPSRFRIFDWLRRRKECGHPCQICRQECEVGAIDLVGRINANECHHCLDCQITYWNPWRCPPLIERRRRRERHARRPPGTSSAAD